MATEKSSFKLFVLALLIFLLLVGLVRITMNGGGNFFLLELLGLLFLAILALVGFSGYAQYWGERVLLFVFLFYATNLVLVWVFENTLYITLVVLSMLGVLLTLPQKNVATTKKKAELKIPEPHSEIFEPLKKEEPKKVFEPGKFVASKNSNVYHLANCDWAKKIAKERRVWFNSKEEALRQGYKEHSCFE